MGSHLLSAYRYKIWYKAGKAIGNADSLSRLAQPMIVSSDCRPVDLVHLVDHLDGTTIKAANIKDWTNKDPLFARVRKYVMEGWAYPESGGGLQGLYTNPRVRPLFIEC